MRTVLVIFLVLIAAVFLFFFVPWGWQSPLKGSAQLKTENYNFDNFTKVEINGPFEVAVSYADNYSVNITANDNIFSMVQCINENNLLKVIVQSSSFMGKHHIQFVDTTMKIAITLPQLRSCSLSGNANSTITGFESRAGIDFNVSKTSTLEIPQMTAGDLNFTVSGQSSVSGNITAGDINLNISATSNIQLGGSGSILNCKASGASKALLDNLLVENAIVNLKNASSGNINAAVKIDADLSGSSDLIYYGNPVMGNTKISGDSTMTKK